jgi:hypothetical protein
MSFTAIGSSPAEAASFIRQEIQRWRQVAAAAGIQPE